MKKVILSAIAVTAMLSAQAQQAFETPKFSDNWSIGLDGGVATPLAHHHAFFGDMRGVVGLHFQKRLSPAFALGIEGAWGINTSSWTTHKRHVAFDDSYVGAYGAVNLMNLFGGYNCNGRLFEIELQAGAGWGHEYANEGPDQNIDKDYNYFATKAGVNFNFNVNRHVTISLKPAVVWNMTGSTYTSPDVDQTSAAYTRKLAAFNCMVGVTYNFGRGFVCADIKNQAEIDALNAQINKLRSDIDACAAEGAAVQAKVAALNAELEACKNRKPEVAKKVNDNLQGVRYVFYKFSSSTITKYQQPNVGMLATYLDNHKDAKVVIKGYASEEGNREFNERLAAARAESVKAMLVKKYGIAADRIDAKGEGIGHMFSENSWNRVAICTIED